MAVSNPEITNHPLGDLKLFEPKENNLTIDYPELAEIPEFKDLKKSDLFFVWWYANRTSPIAKLPKKERWLEAAKKAYGVKGVQRKSVKDILEGKIPDDIKLAIDVMARFDPNMRLRAKFAEQYAFDQLQDMLNMPEDVMSLIIQDPDLMKKRADFIFNATKQMPDMVARIERGYGVTLKNSKKEEVNYKDVASLSAIIDELE